MNIGLADSKARDRFPSSDEAPLRWHYSTWCSCGIYVPIGLLAHSRRHPGGMLAIGGGENGPAGDNKAVVITRVITIYVRAARPRVYIAAVLSQARSLVLSIPCL